MHLDKSKAETFVLCRRRYAFGYVEGRSAPASAGAALVGDVAHAVASGLFLDRLKPARIRAVAGFDLDDVQAVAEREAAAGNEAMAASHEATEEALLLIEDRLPFLDYVFKRYVQGALEELGASDVVDEWPLYLSIDRHAISGRYDLLIRYANKGPRAIDWKIGIPQTISEATDSIQTAIYAILGNLQSLTYVYLNTEQVLDVEITPELRRVAELRVRSLLSVVEAAHESNEFRAVPSKLACGPCPYSSICPDFASWQVKEGVDLNGSLRGKSAPDLAVLFDTSRSLATVAEKRRLESQQHLMADPKFGTASAGTTFDLESVGITLKVAEKLTKQEADPEIVAKILKLHGVDIEVPTTISVDRKKLQAMIKELPPKLRRSVVEAIDMSRDVVSVARWLESKSSGSLF